MRILFISRWYPMPPDNGSKMRVFNILGQLSLHHDVTLATFYEPTDAVTEGTLSVLKNHCQDVHVVPYQAFRPASMKATLGFLSDQPRFLVDTYSEQMENVVRKALSHGTYDLVMASELPTLPYALKLATVPVVLEDLELASFRDAAVCGGSPYRRARAWLTWWKLGAYLRRVLPQIAACTVVSEKEKEYLTESVPSFTSVSVLPNALNLTSYEGSFDAPQPDTLVFSGALTYSANRDAVRYLLQEIFPILLRKAPGVTLRVTGSTDGVALASFPLCRSVEYTGYVADIKPVIAQSWALVVPLRQGGGTRLKILEAMALGTPVVSTSKGAEGLEVVDGQHLLIADDPRTFASRTAELLRSPELRVSLTDKARRLVEGRYDWAVVGKRLDEVVADAARTRIGRLAG